MSDVARNAAAIIMRIGYGYDVKSDDDHFVTIAEEALRVGSAAGAPGKWMVDSLPWRKCTSPRTCMRSGELT